MASDLPSEFDVIVLGTGLPESILAAAFSRNGYSVLHLDKNDHYSSNWASFSTEGVEKWKKRHEGLDSNNAASDNSEIHDLKDGERQIPVPKMVNMFTDVKVKYHIPDELPDTKDKTKEVDHQDGHVGETVESESPCEGQFEDMKEDDVEKSGENTDQALPAQQRKVWTASELKDSYRRFNLDLAPRVLYCSGQMVELLIVSDVAKYCEFRTVSRILTLLNGQLEKVPCSRADVFGSKKVSMLEKRLLMKFLTFCAEHEKYPEQYHDYADKPFSQFLSHKKLTPNTYHFVYHSIAMATEKTTTEEGLKNIQQFLQSLGRYGNTAFLFPLYGSGEIPQGFCRLCAVFGGVYCLQMSASNIILDTDNKCCAVYTTEGQRIECKHLILGPSYIPTDFLKACSSASKVSRAIVVSNKSILPSDNFELSMLHLLPDSDQARPITVLELPPSSMVCPQDTFVLHLTREGSGEPEVDLSPTVHSLCGGSHQHDEKPCILWSVYFSHVDESDLACADTIPSNIYVLPGPGTERDMDGVVRAVRKVWEQICPSEEFLPKPPNPEDIIYVDDAETKVGDGTENAFQDAEEEGIPEDKDVAENRDEIVPPRDQEPSDKDTETENEEAGLNKNLQKNATPIAESKEDLEVTAESQNKDEMQKEQDLCHNMEQTNLSK